MTRNDTPGQLLTPRQAAERMQFTTARPIYRAIHEGRLPASRIGARLLIKQADLDALIDSARIEIKPARPRRLRDLERRR